MRELCFKGHLLQACIVLVTLLYNTLVLAADCQLSVATVSSIKGKAEFTGSTAETSWNPLVSGQMLCEGSSVRVGANSQLSLVLANNSLLQLDQHSTIVLSKISATESGWVRIQRGVAHFISRIRHAFEVQTPFVNAAVEGTEFTVAVENEKAYIGVMEGRVQASNERGQLTLRSGQTLQVVQQRPPVLVTTLTPAQLVQWTLFFPELLGEADLQKLLTQSASTEKWEVEAAITAYKRGDYTSALEKISVQIKTRTQPLARLFTVNLYLLLGRVELAAVINKELLRQGMPEAAAIEALLHTLDGDQEVGLRAALNAFEQKPDSELTHLVLSYAYQAANSLEAALQVLESAPAELMQASRIQARLSELYQSFGDSVKAEQAAIRALNSNPDSSIALMVRGFVYLSENETGNARISFEKALALDSAHPWTRLGFALSLIRDNDFDQGRHQLELACAQHPTISLLRSYLAKAYFEESRYKLAKTQLDLAMQLDEKDPTPWYYSAIMQNEQNNAARSLKALYESVARNDNRSIYRSRFLLDQDNAMRNSDRARVFNLLGFSALAQKEANNSLLSANSDFAAHRFLAESYSNVPQLQYARASEILQAELLQPLGSVFAAPEAGEIGPGLVVLGGSNHGGYGDYSNYFVRNTWNLRTRIGVMGDGNQSSSTVVSGMQDKFSFAGSYYQMLSDGYRENAKQDRQLSSIILNYAPRSDIYVNAQYKDRRRDIGDIHQRLDDAVLDQYRERENAQSSRVGLRFNFNERSLLLVNFETTLQQNYSDYNIVHGPVDMRGTILGGVTDFAHVYKTSVFTLYSGLSHYQDHSSDNFKFPVETGLPPPLPAIIEVDEQSKEQLTDYSIYNYALYRPAHWGQLLAGYSYYERMSKNKLDGQKNTIRQFNPKLGFKLDLGSVELNLAAFRQLKKPYLFRAQLEPSTILDFNQVFDNVRDTDSINYAFSAHVRGSTKSFYGVKAMERQLKYIRDGGELGGRKLTRRTQQNVTVYLNQLAGPVSIAFEPNYRLYKTENNISDQLNKVRPMRLETIATPLLVQFHTSSFGMLGIRADYVAQQGKFTQEAVESLKSRKTEFAVYDLFYRYRHQKYISLEAGVKNLESTKFSYHGINPESGDVFDMMYYPDRLFYFSSTLLL